MKATIFIRGIGLNYPENNEFWKVLFPFDECHTVKFKLSEGDPGISLGGAVKDVRVKVTNPTSVFKVGDRFGDFLDLTSEVAHKDGIRLKQGENVPSVFLTIENAEFTVASSTYCRYQLIDGGNVLTHPQEIAYSAKAIVEGESVTIEAEGVEGFPQTFNQNVSILFDNICPPEDVNPLDEPASDLKLLYSVIEDFTEPSRELTIDRDPAQKPGAIIVDESDLSGIRNRDNKFPGFAGRPCNQFTASIFKT